MNPSPLFRRASVSDLEALLSIEEAWPTTPGWSRAQFERELGFERSYLAVLELEGRVLGYGGLWIIPPEGQVTTLAISPEISDHGYGRLLLGHLVDICGSRGLSEISLEVSDRNKRALRLYESVGFQVVGRRAKFYNDGSDAILMHLPLASRAR